MKNSNSYIFYFLNTILLVLVCGCGKKFFDIPPSNSLSNADLQNKNGVSQVLTAAYAGLKGLDRDAFYWNDQPTNWIWGSIVGQESFKGSTVGDITAITQAATFLVDPTNYLLQSKWYYIFGCINRANAVLKLLRQTSARDISDDDRKRIEAEAIFLRGYFHFEGYKMFKKIPYIDESIDYTENNYYVKNDQDVISKIIADFDFAYKNLPEVMPAIGEANKWAAAAFEAKALLYNKSYDKALQLLTLVIQQGKTSNGTKYSLVPKFRDVFDVTNKNNSETVFAIQNSVHDGSGDGSGDGGNANFEMGLTHPSGKTLCCTFNRPSYDLANSYRTNSQGLPYLDGSYNSRAQELVDTRWRNPGDPVDKGSLDPRLDWTIGRVGIPFLDWGTFANTSEFLWAGTEQLQGSYIGKKYEILFSQFGTYTGNRPLANAVNTYLMRYADVLLMAAEAEVEAGSLSTAMNYVNQVRQRAQNTVGFVRVSTDSNHNDWEAYQNPTAAWSKPACGYNIGLYGVGGDNSFSQKEKARHAVHFERKLEMAMEGHRFFDLIRWGETTLANATGNPVNLEAAYLYNQGLRPAALSPWSFKTGKNEVFPLPQSQIDLSRGTLSQNTGY